MGLSSKIASSDGPQYCSQGLEISSNNRSSKQESLSPLQCPRCDSTNTKFCYYNNYSRLQPRHLCKACKRHWTAGGTLRNLPVGGGHKSKRPKTLKSSNTSTPSTEELNSDVVMASKNASGDQRPYIESFPRVLPELRMVSRDYCLGSEQRVSEMMMMNAKESVNPVFSTCFYTSGLGVDEELLDGVWGGNWYEDMSGSSMTCEFTRNL